MKNIKLHVLNASGKLTPHRETLKEIIASASRKVTTKIPVINVDIVIFDPRDEVSSSLAMSGEMRMGGMCYGPSLVIIPVNGLKFFNSEEKNELAASLAHELFHAVRRQTLGGASSLKEILIDEGLACHFEEEVVGTVRKRYYQSLSMQEIESLRTRAKTEYTFAEKIYEKWFLGKDPSIPIWTGYALGYELVAKYFETHREKHASSLYSKRVWEF